MVRRCWSETLRLNICVLYMVDCCSLFGCLLCIIVCCYHSVYQKCCFPIKLKGIISQFIVFFTRLVFSFSLFFLTYTTIKNWTIHFSAMFVVLSMNGIFPCRVILNEIFSFRYWLMHFATVDNSKLIFILLFSPHLSTTHFFNPARCYCVPLSMDAQWFQETFR